jgi:signal transduction histidine kinase/tetratricopeptide (TPR) repeat protein
VKLNLDWQKRALILFAALILILSVILTVFAIREAEREKLLKQREINQEQQRVVASIIDQVDENISEAEERIFSFFDPSKNQFDENRLTEAGIEADENEPIVAEVFYIVGNGQIHFPLFKPLYTLSGESESSGEIPNEIGEDTLFKAAEDAEFKTKNFSQAIRNYRQLLTAASDRTAAALLMNRMARCYLNAGNPLRALDLYKRIVRDYGKESGPDGIPFALIALYQLGATYSQRGEKQESAETFLELYDGLLEADWILSRTQFYFYMKKVKEEQAGVIAKIEDEEIEKAIAERQAALQQIEKNKLERMATLEDFQQRILPRLMTGKESAADMPGGFSRFCDTAGESTHLVSYAVYEKNSIFGFTLDEEYLIEGILDSVMGKTPIREGWSVQVINNKQNMVYGREISRSASNSPPVAYSRGFEENFPPWTVRIFQIAPDSAQRELNLRCSIYISLVAVVIAALLFGGILAIRSTAKELKLARLKSDFVATVSHEFRTPLTSIRYLADLLQRGRVRKEDRKQEYYETITHESERLSRLIENILDFSKIEAGMKEYEFEEADVAGICRDVISRFQEQAGPEPFTIESEIPEKLPRIMADREALSRALFNLLDNAVKYSGESKKISVRAWEDKSDIFIEVEDGGAGIGKEEQQKVFEKFYRSSAVHESSIKGSGIGLTLVDHIIKAHGGEVVLESELGKGTKVRLRFPKGQDLQRGG